MKSPIDRYINEHSWEVRNEAGVREFFPRVSIADADFPLAPWKPVVAGPIPQFDARTHKLTELAPRNIEDRWETRYRVDELNAEERQQVLDGAWAGVRDERNRLLAECDWTMLPDAPTDKAAWGAYRQALRDVTTQENPLSIAWPESP